ncbi:MAG: N-acetyltransferase [Candidatus Margulisbacteria bacterium]|nr:N-acetyltransferase [Candidatus Margulisiibacteriota bacterium]
MVNNKTLIRKAKIADATLIKAILDEYANQRKLLARSLQYILENIRDFQLAEIDGEVVGTCALKVSTTNLAEIKSLAVKEKHIGTGIGALLVKEVLAEGKELGVKEFFALTYVPDFFYKYGFTLIQKEDLPHKIWTECVHCPFFPNCNETAVILQP